MIPKVIGDRRRDIAGVFLLFGAGGVWLGLPAPAGLPEHPYRLDLVLAVVMIVIGVGLWRANEWARRAGGYLAAFETVKLAVMFVSGVAGKRPPGASTWFVGIALLLFFALFWAAIAVYLLRSSTKGLFVQMREARAGKRAVPN